MRGRDAPAQDAPHGTLFTLMLLLLAPSPASGVPVIVKLDNPAAPRLLKTGMPFTTPVTDRLLLMLIA